MPLDMQTRAAFRPTTLDRKGRTVQVILSTGAPVIRSGFDGPYSERLEISAKAVDLSRMPVPVLDGHRQDGVASILGTLESATIEGGALVGTVRISARHEPLMDDIEAGVIRSVSIGYTVQTFQDRPGENGQKTRTATRWTLAEASFVSVPADPQATTRSDPMPTDTTTAEPPATTTHAPPQVATVTRAETNAEIRALATMLGLPQDFANGLIDREASIDQARAEAIAQVQTRAATTGPRVTAMHQLDSPANLVTRMGEAQFARANPAHTPSEAARPYMGMTTLDMARDVLTRSGVALTGLSPADVITRALHTTSDFPAIFGDTVNRSLRAGYAAAPDTLKSAARRTTARDFRAKTSIQLGEAPTLEKVNEGGEFKHGTMDEAKESYAIDSYGRIFAISRKAMVNDDLGAFVDMAGKWGMAAVEFEAQFLVNLLVANSGIGPNMDDGNALFHASHGNLAASGAILSEATLSAARLAMRTQKGLSGKPIKVTPKYLIVPPALETKAEKLLATVQAHKSDDVNPFGGKLQLLVEARLTNATRWYVAADPAQVEGLEYAYLQGE
ncbi:prohead protease/major capsid protein fusion protein [Oceaniglobus roseus]|uniref:prohead protease/major capsid protein fusion protein n=1 Tax=Oceaniglobus roseus TaxID=1737570 RepID=UPI003183B6AF